MKREIKRAWDNPKFREIFDTDLNKDKDLKQYSTYSVEKLYYYTDNGLVDSISIGGFFMNIENHNGEFVPIKKIKHTPGLLEFINLELNPHIDINSLSSKRHLAINYLSEDNTMKQISLNRLIKILKKNSGEFVEPKNQKEKKTQEAKLAIEYDEFRKMALPELNPDIDINKLIISSRERIKFNDYHHDNRIIILPVNQFIFNVKKNNGKYNSGNIMQLIIDVPEFREWIDLELNKHIDFTKLAKYNSKIPIYYKGLNGEICSIHASSFINNINRNDGVFIPPQQRNIYLSEDEEIELFWSDKNEVDLRTVKLNDKREFIYECPYCGYEFQKKNRAIFMKEQKCSACKCVEKEGEYELPVRIVFIINPKQRHVKQKNEKDM